MYIYVSVCTYILQEGLLNCSQTQLFTCGLLHGLPWVHGPACEDVSFDIHLHRFSPTAHRLMFSMSAVNLFQRFPIWEEIRNWLLFVRVEMGWTCWSHSRLLAALLLHPGCLWPRAHAHPWRWPFKRPEKRPLNSHAICCNLRFQIWS